jgi:hypothetical protein
MVEPPTTPHPRPIRPQSTFKGRMSRVYGAVVGTNKDHDDV